MWKLKGIVFLINDLKKYYLIYLIMEQINSLDLNINILNITGGYVKKDNNDKMQKEKREKIIDEKIRSLKNGYSNMLIKK
jgi:hypothetical protein